MALNSSKTVTLQLVLNIKDWVTKPDYNNRDQYDTEGHRCGNVFELEIFLVFDDGLAGTIINESEDCENDGELWNANASGSKGVNNGPGMAEPSDFGEDEAAGEGG